MTAQHLRPAKLGNIGAKAEPGREGETIATIGVSGGESGGW